MEPGLGDRTSSYKAESHPTSSGIVMMFRVCTALDLGRDNHVIHVGVTQAGNVTVYTVIFRVLPGLGPGRLT